MPGLIEVSPGCHFFQFPNKSEEQLVTGPGLTDLTGTHSHFRITPNGDLLFIVEPPKQPEQLASTLEEQVDECAQPLTMKDLDTERITAALSQAKTDNAALEARLIQAQTALEQSEATKQAAQDRIGALEAEVAGLTDQAAANRQDY